MRSIEDSILDRAEEYIYPLLASLPVTRFAHDATKAYTYRSQVVWEEAQRRGIRMEQMSIFGSLTEVYRAHLHGVWRYFQSIPISARLRKGSAEYMDDKYVLKRRLEEAGIPVPRVASVTSLSQALAAQKEWNTAVAVKPRLGSRARHTSVNIRTAEEAARAFKSAQKLCHYVVLEEYLEGGVCRGTVVGGKLVGFFQGNPPKVTGDGLSTIEELVVRANAQKPNRVHDIILTPEHREFLARRGHSPQSIIPEGITIPLTHRTGRQSGGRTYELLGSEHPKLRSYLERAAEVLKTPLVGFDLIIPDPVSDPDIQKWGIIEANSLPYIDVHYLPLEGEPSNVAASVWDFVEANSARF
ncbi:MAG: hypothetical protein WC050_03685 [Candidatus Paceibacterota bacterium]